MKPNKSTFTKTDAIGYLNRTRRPGQIYLRKFDVDVVFRKGKLDDEQISKIRYKEDNRPQKIYNQRSKMAEDKKNDIVTYRPTGKDELYVLAHSGGVSLFDGMSSKVKLGQKDCWWIITRGAKLEEGLIIVKDVFKDTEGNTHYSIQPDRDMPISEYIEKLDKLKKYMKRIY